MELWIYESGDGQVAVQINGEQWALEATHLSDGCLISDALDAAETVEPGATAEGAAEGIRQAGWRGIECFPILDVASWPIAALWTHTGPTRTDGRIVTGDHFSVGKRPGLRAQELLGIDELGAWV